MSKRGRAKFGAKEPRRKNLREELQDVIRQRIVFGQLLSNVSVGEEALAQDFSVSRTPVREALLGLERDGFVSATRGRGFVVNPLSRDEACECYPVLWTLEVLAVRSSKPDPELISTLRGINDELATVQSVHERVRLDSEWHETLVGMAGNVTLSRITSSIRARVYRYEYAYLAAYSPRERSCDEHTMITDLLERSPKEAARALEAHWKGGLKRLLMMLEGHDSRSE